MRKHPTEGQKGGGPDSKDESVDWRDVFCRDLKQQGEVGVYVRGLRLREGMTQKQLAAKLGKGTFQHHISEMENGKRNISKEMAKRLAKIFSTDYRMFL